MNWFRSFKYMTGQLSPPFLLIRNKLLKTFLLSDKLLKWSPFPALPLLPDLLVFVVSDLILVLLEPSPVLAPWEEEFGNLPLKPRSFVNNFHAGRNSFILPVRVHFGIFCLENNFFRIGWTWVNSSMFIVTRSGIWPLLWEGSFLLKQNVLTVVVGPEFLPLIWPSLIKWGAFSKGLFHLWHLFLGYIFLNYHLRSLPYLVVDSTYTPPLRW